MFADGPGRSQTFVFAACPVLPAYPSSPAWLQVSGCRSFGSCVICSITVRLVRMVRDHAKSVPRTKTRSHRSYISPCDRPT